MVMYVSLAPNREEEEHESNAWVGGENSEIALFARY